MNQAAEFYFMIIPFHTSPNFNAIDCFIFNLIAKFQPSQVYAKLPISYLPV